METHLHVHVYVHPEADQETKASLAEIITRLTALQQGEITMKADLDAIEAKVAEESTVVGGVVTLLGNISVQLQAAKDDPAAVQAIIDHIDANKTALANAAAAVPAA